MGEKNLRNGIPLVHLAGNGKPLCFSTMRGHPEMVKWVCSGIIFSGKPTKKLIFHGWCGHSFWGLQGGNIIAYVPDALVAQMKLTNNSLFWCLRVPSHLQIHATNWEECHLIKKWGGEMCFCNVNSFKIRKEKFCFQ